MPNAKNKEIVNNIKDKLKNAKSVVVTDYLGISSGDANALRQKIKENDAEMLISKNTLVKVAIDETKDENLSEIQKDLKGPTAIIFSFSDPISPIKALFEFGKKSEFVKVKSAVIEGIYADQKQVEVIKDLPSKEVLIGQMLGALKSPLNGFAQVLNGVQRKFVYAVDAIAKKKGGVN